MSTNPASEVPDRVPTVAAGPLRRCSVGTFNRYEEAQRAVDFMSDERFAVQHVSIVGEGLRIVEDVTGRKGYLKAAIGGATSGAIIGALIGLTFGLIMPFVSAFTVGLYWLFILAVAGALAGLVGHALTRGRRDFASTGRIEATQYHIVVDESAAEQARTLLNRLAEPSAINR